MSTHSNPFIQGGWYGTSMFSLGPDQGGQPPSVYGALPMIGGQGPNGSSATNVHFQFTNPNPNILNSTVVGPGQRPVMRVATDQSLAGYTAFKDTENRSIALIEWQARPRVEIRGTVTKMNAADWLRVVMDPRFGRPVRQMEVRGAKFTWCPNGEALLLFTQTPNSNPVVMVTKNRHVVDLELTEQAISWGLLESCIVAITLLLSGRRIE